MRHGSISSHIDMHYPTTVIIPKSKGMFKGRKNASPSVLELLIMCVMWPLLVYAFAMLLCYPPHINL